MKGLILVKEATQTFVIAAKKGKPPRVVRKGYRPQKNDKVLKTHSDFFAEVEVTPSYSRAHTAVAPPGEPQPKPSDD